MTFKINKTNAYTVMSNYHLRDRRLSLKAKGLLSLMLSLPDNWDYSIAGLVAISTEGQTAIESALRELQESGYIFIKKIFPDKSATGKIEYEYNIYEMPVNALQTPVKEPIPEKQSNDTPKKKKDEIKEITAKYTGGNAETAKLIKEWLEIRKIKRLGVTKGGVEYNLKKLSALAKDANMTVNEYLEAVIARGWGAFYPINDRQIKSEKPETKPTASYDIDKFKENALADDLIYRKKDEKQ
ncbi:MAG: hypothetical protein J6S85_02780 [Methanobrevibacter sp.]|nr:hypothetical protein [Methanobrevibacter sp.]MBO7712465.1 hypothetical protein [Methanobrevibacter sp.]